MLRGARSGDGKFHVKIKSAGPQRGPPGAGESRAGGATTVVSPDRFLKALGVRELQNDLEFEDTRVAEKSSLVLRC